MWRHHMSKDILPEGESYPFDHIYKVPSTLYKVRGFANKWLKYLG